MLYDEIKLPKGSEKELLRKFRDHHHQHPQFLSYVSQIKDPNAQHIFGISHFAGMVYYSIEDFLEKNRDTLPAQLDRLAGESQGFLGQALFSNDYYSLSSSPKKTPAKGKSLQRNTSARAHQKVSLIYRFRTQLDELMTKISKTQTHFVRCIKPNDDNLASIFHGSIVLEQLNYGGVLETCRIRKEGFQVRRSHDDFLATYLSLARYAKTPEEMAKILETKYGRN